MCTVHSFECTQNLFPVQIENVLTDHGQIREAAAVAVPDAKFGEVVGVWIVREGTSVDFPDADNISGSDVRAWVASRMNPQVCNTKLYNPLRSVLRHCIERTRTCMVSQRGRDTRERLHRAPKDGKW